MDFLNGSGHAARYLVSQKGGQGLYPRFANRMLFIVKDKESCACATSGSKGRSRSHVNSTSVPVLHD